MDQFLTKLAEQVAVIRATPYPFFLAVAIVAGGLAWYGVRDGLWWALDNGSDLAGLCTSSASLCWWDRSSRSI
jgi:hypothetical protein